jgi:hypothetical protein
MTSRPVALAASRTPRLAAIGVAASLASVVFIVAVTLVFLMNGQVGAVAFSLLPVLLILDMSLVGGLLAIRRRDNAIGSIMLGAGFLAACSFATGYYSRLDDFLGGNRLPLVAPVAWIGTWTFTPAIGLMVVFLPLLFPTGHLPGPRWRALAVAVIVALTIGAVQSATAPGPMNGITSAGAIVNPVQLPEPLLSWIQMIGAISSLLAPPAFLLAIASVVARFRTTRGIERQQLKWFLFVASIAAFALGLSIVSVGPVSDWAWIVGLLAVACLPLAIGVAILRYRLYEIDRIVSRTVSYGALTALLATVFVTVNLGLDGLLASATRASSLAVAASTLIVFALFQPLRRRVQKVVDRRFNRARYESDRIAAAFAERLTGQVDPDRLQLELDTILAQTVAPARSDLWLRREKETGP